MGKNLRLDEVGIPTIKKDIAENIERVLMRLGIHARIEVSEKKIYNGRYVVKIESETFNTTPVIYKSVNVYGDGWFIEEDAEKHTAKLTLDIGYRFCYFDGGSNGVDIGTADFRFTIGNEKNDGRTFFVGLTLR